jgi:DNA-binding response OmpR family regulator
MKNILIVDDHEESIDALKRALNVYLKDKNLNVLPAHDLRTGLSIAHVRKPIAACCLDLRLPDSEPENTMKNIMLFGCPVMVVSGSGSVGTRKLASTHGAVDFIEKPIVPEVFIDKLTRILQRYDRESDYSEASHRVQSKLAQERIELATTRVRFDGTLGLGHIIQIALLLAAGIGLYINSQIKFNDLAYRVGDVERASKERTELLSQLTERVSRLTSNQEKIADTLKLIVDGYEFKPKPAKP